MIEARIAITLVTLFYAAIFHSAPVFRRSDRLFGVRLPAEYLNSEAARRILHRYEMRLLPVSVVAVVAPLLARLSVAPLLSVALNTVLLAVSLGLFSAGFKEARRHALPSPSIRTAALTSDRLELRELLLYAIPAFLILGATALYLHAHWSEIPPRFPVHWGANGQPNGWSEKSVRGVYGALFFGSAVAAWMIILLIATYRGARNTAHRFIAGVILVAAMYISAAVFSLAALFPLHVVSAWVLLVLIFVPISALLIWGHRRANSGTSETTPEEKWVMPGVYYNPGDAATFVERQFGIGYTVNLAHPLGIVLVLALLVSLGLLLRFLM